ncbi:MAG: MG2 domain-containing protein [Firmicutes bacterium]|nr:MG2 domain-containing protein [Bacillota bacterium]
MKPSFSSAISRTAYLLLILIWIGALFSLSISKEKPVGSVSGKVFRRDNHRPIARARVFYPGEDRWVRTDKDGTFKLPGVPAGKYEIDVSARGFDSSYITVYVEEGTETRETNFAMEPTPPEIDIYAGQKVFMPGEKVKLNLSSSVINKFELTVYRINPLKDISAITSYESRRKMDVRKLLPVYFKKLKYNLNEDGIISEQVEIPLKEKGVYLVEVAQADNLKFKRRTWFSISDLALVAKQSPEELMVYAAGFKSRKPLPGTNIVVFKNGNGITSGTTDSSGIYHSKIASDSYEIVGLFHGSFAFVRSYSYGSPDPYRAYIYTERPVYRPGQTVYFKAVIRKDLGDHYNVFFPGTARVKINDCNGNLIYSQDFRTGNYGTFHGEMTLQDEPPLGDYTILVNIGKNEYYQKFKVAEYKKPEYKVEVSTGKPHYVAGEEVSAKIKAAYYFGAPVESAKIRYTVYESAYHMSGNSSFRYYGEEDEESYGGILKEGTASTDKKGEAEIKIPTKKSDRDNMVGIEVEVEDLSNRTVTASTSVLITRGFFDLWSQTDKYIYQPGDTIKLEINALNYDNKAVENVKVDAKVLLNKYIEGENRWEKKQTLISTFSASTNKQGKGTISFKPEQPGEYEVQLSSVDSGGNIVKYTDWIFVSSGNYTGTFNNHDLTLTADKKIYKRGDSAKILINCLKADSYVLLTIEGRKIYKAQVIFVKGHSKMIDVPLEKEYFPNVYISACSIKGKEFVNHQIHIDISPEEKFLNISIKPGKEKYAPGDTASYFIKITDSAGKPVKAELSLGVVDSSIYAISPEITENIKDFFYTRQSNFVGTTYSFEYDYSGGADKEGAPRVRKYFPDTAYWGAVIFTDDKGTAKIDVKLPDNITAWKATVRAVTMDTKVGSAVNEIIATKDLLVRLEVPRFITQRDVLEIAGVIHNYTDKEQPLKVELACQGVELLDKAQVEKNLPAGEAVRIAWKVKASNTGTAVFTVKAAGHGASDAMELSIPVLPHGIENYKAYSGDVEKEKDFEVEVPSGIISGATKLNLYLAPSVAGAMMQGLDYLASYPYGCVEQTMSSFLPDIFVEEALKKLNIKDAGLEKKLPLMVQKGLQRLYGLQHEDGGWGWWTDDSTHPYMTAYVVFGLLKAKEAGYKIDDNVLDRGKKALEKIFRETYGETKTGWGAIQQKTFWKTKAYMAYVMSLAGILKAEDCLKIYENRDKLNAYTKALLALALNNLGRKDEILALINELNSQAVETDTTCNWESETFDYSWTGNNVESTAYVLDCLVNLDTSNPRIPKIIRWLFINRRGLSWNSTKDTAAVLYAFTDYLIKNPEELAPDFTASIYLNGEKIKDVKFNSLIPSSGESAVIIESSKLKSGKNKITIQKEGKGKLYYSAELRYFPDVENIKPASQGGIKISRVYKSLKLEKDIFGKFVEKEEKFGGTLGIGERLLVKISVECDKDFEYLIIEDPLPAGCEVVIPEGERNWGSLWWCRQEIRDEKAVFFSRFLEKGQKFVLSYEIRGEIPGDYHVLPTLIYQMYIPEVRANGEEAQIKVR